jgi:hypothetical protein
LQSLQWHDRPKPVVGLDVHKLGNWNTSVPE